MAKKALPPKKRVKFRFTSNPKTSLGGGRGNGDGAAAAPASAPQREPPAPSSLPRSPSPPEPFTYDPGAGSNGGGGGGDGAAAAPASAPRREPPAPSSPPRSPSPPEPFTYDPGAGSNGGGPAVRRETSYSPPPLSPSSDDDEVRDAEGRELSYSSPSPSWPSSDDEDSEEEKPESQRYGAGSLFMSDPQVISMYSDDPQDPPRYIGRQNCEPLARQKFLSLRHNWQQLLDGKKTYLRPPKNNRVAKDNYDNILFVTPEPPGLAVHLQGPISYLVGATKGIPIIQLKYKILSKHYVSFRPMRSDGSQFYRAFLFSYLENLGKMQGSEAEVTRLMERVERSRVNFRRLQWNNAYFSNPEAFFSSVVTEFEHLVNSVANGLNSDELYAISLQEISSSRILCLLRLLTEVHIRTHKADYNRVLDQKNALSFCIESVRPFGTRIEAFQMGALPQALGIPVHIAFVDSRMKDGTVQVQCADFIPQSETVVSRTSVSSGSKIIRYCLSSATDKHPVLPAGNLFSSDRMPLVTMSITNANTIAILYRK